MIAYKYKISRQCYEEIYAGTKNVLWCIATKRQAAIILITGGDSVIIF